MFTLSSVVPAPVNGSGVVDHNGLVRGPWKAASKSCLRLLASGDSDLLGDESPLVLLDVDSYESLSLRRRPDAEVDSIPVGRSLNALALDGTSANSSSVMEIPTALDRQRETLTILPCFDLCRRYFLESLYTFQLANKQLY